MGIHRRADNVQRFKPECVLFTRSLSATLGQTRISSISSNRHDFWRDATRSDVSPWCEQYQTKLFTVRRTLQYVITSSSSYYITTIRLRTLRSTKLVSSVQKISIYLHTFLYSSPVTIVLTLSRYTHDTGSFVTSNDESTFYTRGIVRNYKTRKIIEHSRNKIHFAVCNLDTSRKPEGQ